MLSTINYSEFVRIKGMGNIYTSLDFFFQRLTATDRDKVRSAVTWPCPQNVENCVLNQKKETVLGYRDYKSFIDSLGNEENKLFVFRITHRSLVDEVLKSIGPFLKKGDIILDGRNEWYLNLEARQKKLREKGVGYIGISMGIFR